ncbi:FAD-dependent oxidoreductase [Dinghuibacter silviterrae]|uniref:2-polyprenyl-6-methoxyphenol hydroxylase-like FAD-dependent oxidoreductase n=1 Tax=Dinghuibacter silviterrae TaxID=1539049 RepID=A0A4R8DP20_9BACT|nr:NAD(P)/FAD-dependent oxidoreductase [Dinghuibacter silviterrae]TDW99811.1 2-polyprenyl-6-methoxyphenol hydroxylase-like FAD-dependent oxidoreductase [Dinghuibacter silviterrae]
MKKHNVLIIGGGIGGLALALALKKSGVPCAVYEAFDYKQGVGAGFNIAPNGMKVLGTLGVADKIIAKGSVVNDHWFRSVRGKVIAHMRNGKPGKYEQPGVSLSRAAVYEVLTEEIHAKGIEIHYNKRLRDMTDEGLRIVAHFEDGTSATGAVLMGADGLHSKVRELIFPDAPKPEFTGLIGVGGFVPADAVPHLSGSDQHSLTYIPGPEGFVGYTGAGEGQMMWWGNYPSEHPLDQNETGAVPAEGLRRRMLTRFCGYPSPVNELIAGTTRAFALNDMALESLPTWHSGKVLLIGDAAHAVSSSSGQGASLALEDALYLARLFRDVQEGYASVFAQFERARRPRVEKIIAEGKRRRERKKATSPLEVRVGEWMMRFFIGLFGERSLDKNYSYTVEF